MAELEITFLGTGTSHGIPVIGCQCAICHSSDPRDKRLRTSTLVRSPEMTFVFDTTPDFRAQCLRHGICHLDAVVYTHSHTDHVLGFDDLRRFCEMTDREMPVYASPETMGDLQRVFRYAFDGSANYRNYIRPDPRLITGPFYLGETLLTPVRLPHGRAVVHGFILSRRGEKLFAYMTDCQQVPEEAEEAARGVKVLVVDALRHATHSTHMTLSQAMDAAVRIQAEKTYFIHMCHDLGHAATESLLPETMRLAYDGLSFEI